jgi:integrase
MSARLRKRGNRWVTTIYVNGTRRWLSAATRPELEDKLAQAIADRRHAEQTSEPVDTFAARWTTDYPRRKHSTNLHNAERVSKFATDFAGVLLVDVTRQDARAWALANRSRWKNVRAMFTDAVRDGLATDNPFRDLRLQSNTRGRRDLVAPTEEDVQRLAELACEVHGDYGLRVYSNMIIAAAYTGLRPGELYALRWSDIDWKRATITVERQYSQRAGVMTSPKNDRSRVIQLLPVAHRALNAVPRQRNEVFFTPQGRLFTGRVQGYYWRPVKAAFGRPDLDWYALRHSFGTMLAQRGVGPQEIALMMGHQDGGKLALSTYIHVQAKDARARVAAAFGSNVVELERERGSKTGAQGA